MSPATNPNRDKLHADDYEELIGAMDNVATHLHQHITADGPFHATNDGLVDELVLLADDLIALAACMTSEAFIHILDRVAALPGGSGRPIRMGTVRQATP